MKKAIVFLFLCLVGAVSFAACAEETSLPPGYTAIDADPTGEIVQGICTEYGCDSEGNYCSYFPSGCDGSSGGGGSGGGGGGGGSCYVWGPYCTPWECETRVNRAFCGDYMLDNNGYKSRSCTTSTICDNGDAWENTYSERVLDRSACPGLCNW